MNMKKMTIWQNEQGLTLIEVIASLVIISIVLISFLGLLLQSTKHTKYNKDKLTEVDVAEQVVADLRESKCEQLEGKEYSIDYKVALTCDANHKEGSVGEEGLPENLKRAIITVTTKSPSNEKKSPFATETYYKVDTKIEGDGS